MASSAPTRSCSSTPITETKKPPAFEFQSDLSDDDDDAPDPLALDEIPNASLTLTRALESLGKEGEGDGGREEEAEGRESKSPKLEVQAHTNGEVDSVTAASASAQAKGVRFVDVEVALPWLPPAQRAEYQYVKVKEGEYHRGRRKRHAVSQICLNDLQVGALSDYTIVALEGRRVCETGTLWERGWPALSPQVKCLVNEGNMEMVSASALLRLQAVAGEEKPLRKNFVAFVAPQHPLVATPCCTPLALPFFSTYNFVSTFHAYIFLLPSRFHFLPFPKVSHNPTLPFRSESVGLGKPPCTSPVLSVTYLPFLPFPSISLCSYLPIPYTSAIVFGR